MDLMQFKRKQMRDFLKLNYGLGKEFFEDDTDNDSMVADQNEDAPSMDISLDNFEEDSKNNSLLSNYYAS
jgi:hypothetical protein